MFRISKSKVNGFLAILFIGLPFLIAFFDPPYEGIIFTSIFILIGYISFKISNLEDHSTYLNKGLIEGCSIDIAEFVNLKLKIETINNLKSEEVELFKYGYLPRLKITIYDEIIDYSNYINGLSEYEISKRVFRIEITDETVIKKLYKAFKKDDIIIYLNIGACGQLGTLHLNIDHNINHYYSAIWYRFDYFPDKYSNMYKS